MYINQNKNQNHAYFMRLALQQARKTLGNTKDNPAVGCVIVKNNQIIAEGSNEVTKTNDPTAHAEIVTIRNACNKLKNFNLEGTELFTSCEPCPMCLSAIYWSHINKIYYANSRLDAAKIGFDDNFIYDELLIDLAKRKIPSQQINQNEAIKAFEEWGSKTDKIKY